MRRTVVEHVITLPTGRVIRPLSVKCPVCRKYVGFDRTDAERSRACVAGHGTIEGMCHGTGTRLTLVWPKALRHRRHSES